MLEGKVAVITGSTRGIGYAIAQALAAQGCNVMLNGFADRELVNDRMRALRDTFRVKVDYDGADLTSANGAEQLVESTAKKFGSVDIVVNNAGVRHFGPIDTFKVKDWDESIAVNVSAPFHMIRKALPLMREHNWGRIINMSSAYGFLGGSERVDYITTKTALLGLTRAVAVEVAKTGITCNALCPGTTLTEANKLRIDELMDKKKLSRPEAEAQFLDGKSPAGRFVRMESLAAMTVFLCGLAGADINGAALPVDLGWTAGR
jgi:3-hydroxybutyrate dehydrogenase